MRKMKIKVYMMDISSLMEEEKKDEFQRLCATLSKKRQKKIEKFRYTQGKCLSLGAGLLLDYGLRQYGLREQETVMIYGADEKPYLKDYPEIFFNLSHSGTMAMAVFGNQEVGCDVEQIKKAEFRVAHRFFASEETRVLTQIQEETEQNVMFYRFWTLKESFLKVTGKGIRMPLNEFSIHLGPSVWVERKGRQEDYTFAEFSLPKYRAAVCVKGGGKDVKIEEPQFFDVSMLYLEGIER